MTALISLLSSINWVMQTIETARENFAQLISCCDWLSASEQFLALAAYAFMSPEEARTFQESLIREGKLRGIYVQVHSGE